MDLPSKFSTAGCSISLCETEKEMELKWQCPLCELDFSHDLIDNLFIIFQASLCAAGREARAVFQRRLAYLHCVSQMSVTPHLRGNIDFTTINNWPKDPEDLLDWPDVLSWLWSMPKSSTDQIIQTRRY